MEKRTDCAFFAGGRTHCSCLTSASCEGCSFFKTKQTLAAGRKAAIYRLKRQPNAPILLDKYYGSKHSEFRKLAAERNG